MHPSLSAILSAHLLDRSGGFRKKVLASARRKAEADFWDRDRIEAAQTQSLAILLRHAAGSVDAWREHLPASDEINTTNARALLGQLPVMTRQQIQESSERYQASNVSPTFTNSTGGSTGTPMNFKIDRQRQIEGEASHIWANGLSGWRYGERIAMLWGADQDVQSARSSLRNRIENIRWFNAFNMGEGRMKQFHQELSTFRPHLLVAYAGSAFLFARFLEAEKCRPTYPLRGIVTSAEVITETMRDKVQTVFGKPVFDRYGSREFGPVAAESTAHAGLHVNELDVLNEIDSPDPYRQPGPLRITYLKNHAMPFIRYETGDLARFAPDATSSCGRRTIRLAPIVGRESDTIRTASGELIHGEYFTHLLYGVDAVKQFQFVQESLTEYRLLLVGRRDRDK
ncbi:MAG: hypothetical protein AAF492_02225, partial [Verrucomicrobiota bacterium]